MTDHFDASPSPSVDTAENTVHISAVALRHPGDGSILTVRKHGTELFQFPGGKPEGDESPTAAACRELDEEIGWSPATAELTLIGTFRAPAANEPGLTVEATIFSAPVDPATHPVPAAEIAEMRWVEPRIPAPCGTPLAPLMAVVFPVLAAGNGDDNPASIDSLTASCQRLADEHLGDIDHLVTSLWARPVTWRQPIHTVYVPAPAVTDADLCRRWGNEALSTAYRLGGLTSIASELGLPDASDTAARALAKLVSEPIEDLRIDFEDGFTQRGIPAKQRDADEDAHAARVVDILAAWLGTPTNQRPEGYPSFAGLRIKSFDPATRARGLRTLVTVLRGLADRGVLEALHDPASPSYAPRALRITLPKVQHARQVETFVEVLEHLEEACGWPADGWAPLSFEVQIETPQAILAIPEHLGGPIRGQELRDADTPDVAGLTEGGTARAAAGAVGSLEAARILAAGGDRLLALHYGTYDYSASLGIDAAEQSMDHPVADFAKDVLQVACSGVGVELSDGSTNRIPVGDDASIRAGWETHHRLVLRHLSRGLRQGWDLHPNQLITRHLTTIGYFRRDWRESAERLADYVAGRTTRWMDEPATAKALTSYLRRAHRCGALTEEELAVSTLTPSLTTQTAQTASPEETA